MRFVLAICFALLAGCSTSQTANYYTQTVDSWRGGNVKSLTARWGTPDMKIRSPSGNTILMYKTTSYRTYNTSYSPAVGVILDNQGRPVIVTSPNNINNNGNRNLSITCVTLFEADSQGKIISAQSKGPGCYGNPGFSEQRSNH